MSGGVRSGGAVSIPASVRKTIQNLKEIAGNHSDEEIYAMLKECGMDPNETAQKLLYQEDLAASLDLAKVDDRWLPQNANSRDSGDAKSRQGNQGRGGRGGRGNYPPRYISYDAGGGRGSNLARENGGYQSANRAASNSAIPPTTTSQNVQTKPSTPGTSSLPTSASGPSVIPNGTLTNVRASQVSGGSWSAASGHNTMADVLKATSVQQSSTQPQTAPASTTVIVQGQAVASSQQYITSLTPTSVSGVYSSSSDPVLVPSLDPRVSDSELKPSGNDNSASMAVHPFSHDRDASKSQTVDGDHLPEIHPQVSTSGTPVSSVGRSVMGNHYNIRPQQQLVGSQKAVGPNKEWKPKPTNQTAVPSPGIIGTSTVSTSASEVSRSPSPASNSVILEDAAAKLQKKLDELNVRDDQHVIIPNHLQVPEAERTSLSFGSFDASFGTSFNASYGNDDESDKSSTPLSEESQVAEETIEEPSSSISNTASVTPNEEYSHHQLSSPSSVENLSPSTDATVSVNPTVAPQSDPSKPEVVVQQAPQYSLVQTAAPSYSSIGLMPQSVPIL